MLDGKDKETMQPAIKLNKMLVMFESGKMVE
jgi:hypothetical protein